MNDPRELIPNPCSENWHNMSGDERSRFCEKCATKIHNLDGLSVAEIKELQQVNGGNLCGKIGRGIVLGASVSSLALASCAPQMNTSHECTLGIIAPTVEEERDHNPFPGDNPEGIEAVKPIQPRSFPPARIGKVMMNPNEKDA